MEVHLFYISEYPGRTPSWASFRWDVVSHVHVFGPIDPALMCHAHANNASIHTAADVDAATLHNATAWPGWVSSVVSSSVSNWTDGVNLDIEGLTDASLAPLLVSLMHQLSDALTTARGGVPGYLSFDAAVYPSGRAAYNYTALARVMDALIPMAYDMSWGAARASANSPIYATAAGMAQYANASVPASSLVMGYPWYGYSFPCVNSPPQRECKSAPGFSGAWSRTYAQVLDLIPSAIGGVQFDNVTASPYFNYIDAGTGVWHQMWYDDEQSLTMKYHAAKAGGARGVAMWASNFLNYTSGAHVASMWDALASSL